MNFWCNLIAPKDYCVEVYPVTNRSSQNQSQYSEDSDSVSNKITPNESPQSNAFLTPSFSPNTIRSSPSSLRQESNNSTSTQASISPQRFVSEFGVLGTLQVVREQVSDVLKQKEKIAHQHHCAEGVVLRMIRKSAYETISKSDNKGVKWKDQAFANYTTYKECPGGEKSIEIRWERVEVWAERAFGSGKSPCFMDDKFMAKDVMQGTEVGDCYFLSSVAALMRRPQRILRLFPSAKVSKKGVYMARMMFKGVIQEVVVDDCFPVNAKNSQLIGCRPSSSSSLQIYVMILEKCWAKLWGSYDAINGGFPHKALLALTGAPSKYYLLNNETSTSQKNQSFFKQLQSFFRKDFVMCAGTTSVQGQAKIYNWQSQGEVQIVIAQKHVYTVEDIYEYDDGKNKQKRKIVRLFNPWGCNTTEKGKKLIQGQILIAWEEFLKNFQYISVCKIRDNAHYLYTELQHCKLHRFTFIQLNVFQANTGHFSVILSETDSREEDHRFLVVTFLVLKTIINPHTQTEEYQFIKIRTQAQYSDHYLELDNLSKGKYIIGIYFSQVEVKEHLTLGVYSEDAFGFSEKKMSRDFEQNFLYNMFQSYNSKAQDPNIKVAHIVPGKDLATSFNFMVGGSIFSYYLLHVGKGVQQAYQLQIQKDVFAKNKMKIWEPYDTEETMIARPGFQTIVILTLQDYRESKNNQPPMVKAKKGSFLKSK